MMDDAPGTAQVPLFQESSADPRADRGRREIAISTQRVTIRRHLHGIDMRLTLAVSDYSGVALCLRPHRDGTDIYQIRLVHRDSDLSILLDEAADDRDIIADWRLWARVLGRPALVEREVGRYEPASGVPVAGEVAQASVRRRRPLKRRPRFLARRRMGHLAETPTLHSGEREIIARN